jgi:hypothetical protein
MVSNSVFNYDFFKSGIIFTIRVFKKTLIKKLYTELLKGPFLSFTLNSPVTLSILNYDLPPVGCTEYVRVAVSLISGSVTGPRFYASSIKSLKLIVGFMIFRPNSIGILFPIYTFTFKINDIELLKDLKIVKILIL